MFLALLVVFLGTVVFLDVVAFKGVVMFLGVECRSGAAALETPRRYFRGKRNKEIHVEGS